MCLGQKRRLRLLGKTCFSCSKTHYLDWWLKAIELSRYAAWTISSVSDWFSYSSLISLIDFRLQLANKPTSPTLNWKWSEGWYYSLFQTHRQQNSLHVDSSTTAKHGTSEVNHDQVCSDCRWCPVNCKSSRANSWTEQTIVKPASWASPVQSPNSDGIKSNMCQISRFSYLPKLHNQLINHLISCALKVKSHHMWASSLKSSLHFPDFSIIATSVTHAKPHQKAPTLLTTQPLVTQICITSPLEVFFPV